MHVNRLFGQVVSLYKQVEDCADAVVPALKGNFSRSKRTLVMLNEARAEMVIRCKKLFCQQDHLSEQP